jgi:predicted nucleic acid-binding protein
VIVADTNLVAYGAIEGDRTEAAARVRRRDADWVAPPLWASEFLNVLVTQVRAGKLTVAQARAVWPAARALVREVESDPLAALDLAAVRGLSGYDAEFVALAARLGVRVVTDDRRVLAACPDLAVSLDAFADEGNGGEGAPPDAPDW